MAKSTAAAALASLSHKFRAKIREVGSLKAQLKAQADRFSEGVAEAQVVKALTLEVNRLRLRNDNLSNDLIKSDKALKLAEFEVTQAAAAYGRLQSHTRDVDGVLKELRGDVASWKSFTVVAVVLGAAVGALGMLSYIVQTSPL